MDLARGLRAAFGLKLSLQDESDGHPDASQTRERSAALQQVDRMTQPALVVFLDIHPDLSNPIVRRTMKEVALKAEARDLQLLSVGHDIDLPDELSPHASRFELGPMALRRVPARFAQ